MIDDEQIEAITKRLALARGLVWVSGILFVATSSIAGYTLVQLNNNYVKIDVPYEIRTGDKVRVLMTDGFNKKGLALDGSLGPVDNYIQESQNGARWVGAGPLGMRGESTTWIIQRTEDR